MTSLPKRGDRVRVTEFMAKRGVAVVRATPVVLTEDARDHGEGYVSFRYLSPASETFVGPVKVEILERAGCFDCCGGSDEHPPEHTQDCSARQESERVCADCGLPVSHRVHRGFGPCGGQSTKTIHPEFARGMRRAVFLCKQLVDAHPETDWSRVDAAIEKELFK